jgi:hypothetical protein
MTGQQIGTLHPLIGGVESGSGVVEPVLSNRLEYPF